MSTKALKTQLLAAVAMVLVASVALGSSTYAWFASNNKVTAKGTAITAKSNSTYLLIGTKDNATDKSESDITKTTVSAEATLYPCAYTANEIAADTNNANVIRANSWYTAHSKDKNKAADTVLGRTAIDLSNAEYLQKNEFWLTLSQDSEAANNKTLTIAFSLADESSDESISAAVYIGEATTPILLSKDEGKSTGTATISLTATSSVKVTVYTYIDGTSEHVNSDHFNRTQTTNKLQGVVNLDFTLSL